MEETPTSDRVDLPPSSSFVPPSNPQIFLSPMIESFENGDGAPEIGSDGELKDKWIDSLLLFRRIAEGRRKRRRRRRSRRHKREFTSAMIYREGGVRWKVRWGDREKPVTPVLVSKVLTSFGVDGFIPAV